MRPQSVDGWLNECAAAAEVADTKLVYRLVLDDSHEGYITAKCDAHAVNVAKKYHGAVEAHAGWSGRERTLWASTK